MRMKTKPEDFIVKEMSSVKASGSGDYTWCTLKKRNWDLLKLLEIISKKLGIPRSEIGYAGKKDKVAVTSQKISFHGVGIDEIKSINIGGVEFSDFEKSDRQIKLGDLDGNWFSITVRGLSPEHTKSIDKRIDEIRRDGVVNMFDTQRFGSRNVTHLVGKEIVKNRIPEAVYTYLTKTNKDERPDIRNVRRKLAETGDIREALNRMPKECKWDILLLKHLVSNKDDYSGAIRTLPKTLQLMFINAYQSHIWNLVAAEFSRKFPRKNIKVPMVGLKTKIEDKELDKMIKSVLNMEKVKLSDFKLRSLPELSSEGSVRDLIIYPKSISYSLDKDELSSGQKLTLEFEIPKGSYATYVVKSILSKH